MYSLPKTNFPDFKSKNDKILNNKFFQIVVLIAFFALGVVAFDYVRHQAGLVSKDIENTFSNEDARPYTSTISYEQAIIDAVREASPSVVSIIISKNLPIYEQQFINPFGDNSPFSIQIPKYVQQGTELREIGAGSGFIVSEDGLVLTNKHVVLDEKAEYTVLANDGKKYSAKVLALDPVQDLAIIKIEGSEKFKAIKLGNSEGIQIGQGVIAIGNALGRFSNTVSVGIVSGLGRTISASDQTGDFIETLENIIQTDAAINQGNSGGPLINLKGEVIGINTATAQGAQTIGFAIPVNIAKKDIQQVIKNNKIVYPFLGVRYVLVDEEVKAKYKLSEDYGAYVLQGDDGEPAITKDSAADKAGVKAGDLILEVKPSNSSGQAWEKITAANSMSRTIQKYNAGDKVTLKILRDGGLVEVEVVLGER